MSDARDLPKSCLTFSLEAAELAALREGRRREEVFAELYRLCVQWVSSVRPGLEEALVVEVVVEALYDSLDPLLDPAVPVHQLVARIRRALARSLRGRERERRRKEGTEQTLMAGLDFERLERELQVEFFVETARVARDWIPIAIDLMRSPERDVLIDHAGLTGLGHSIREAEAVVFATPAERQEAVRRALWEFSRLLEGLIEAVRVAQSHDPVFVARALDMVRGAPVSQAVGLLVGDEQEP